MEKLLNLVSKLSLHEMALRRVAVNLWSESVIVARMQKVRRNNAGTTFNQKEWEKIIDRVKDKVLKLALPESLKEKMMHLVRPVGREIIKWKFYHEYIFGESHQDLSMHILEKVCWTCIGTVDYQKTAEKLVRLKALDVAKRYRLACLYCLEQCIPVLWEELPETYKSHFDDEAYPVPEKVVHLEYYWASVLKGEEIKQNYILPTLFVNAFSPRQAFFKYSVCEGSKAATKYFFQKLNDEERDSALYRALCATLERASRLWRWPGKQIKHRSDVFCYVLSLMTKERQIQVFKKHPSGCLMFFLDWPWQDLFLDIVDHIWNFLPESQYDLVFDRLNENIFLSCYYFPNLFQKFFTCSPYRFRKRFIECKCGYRIYQFFCKFVALKDAETVKVVLGNLDSDDRVRLLSNHRFFNLFYDLMCANKRQLIEMFVGETVLPKEEREVLKEAYMRFCEREGKSKGFFEWLDKTSASTNDTKCSEDEMLTKTKRLSNEEEKCDTTKKLKIQ